MLPSFTTFFEDILSAVSSFLLSPPISYFVGLTVLFFVARLVDYMIHGRRA